MRAISFIVAAIAAKVSAEEDVNEASDNAYYMSTGYGHYMPQYY